MRRPHSPRVDGSLQAVKNAGNTVTMASYEYTYAGLLETANYGDSRTLANTWDADSNRVRLNLAAGQYDFVYDVTAGIPAVIEEVNAGTTSTTTAYYFREPSGALIAWLDGSGMHYYHFDALGSTRMLTDASGVITDKYSYDAYGALLSHDRLTTGSIDQPYQYVGQLGYYTHYQEPDFGLLQLGVRFYDPEVGRFASRDPAEEGIVLYIYVGANPVGRVDPTGMYQCAANGRRIPIDTGGLEDAEIDYYAREMCGDDGRCRSAARKLMENLKSPCGVIHCRICNHAGKAGTHHPFEKLIGGVKRTCWMQHIQADCINERREDVWRDPPRQEWGKCYKYERWNPNDQTWD